MRATRSLSRSRIRAYQMSVETFPGHIEDVRRHPNHVIHYEARRGAPA
jgi:hypothetical protein